jgi:dipeptidyl aminopeptidase/acylaminoacyl peptidase
MFWYEISPGTKTYTNRIQLLNLDEPGGSGSRWLNIDPHFTAVFYSPGPTTRGNFSFTPDGKALAFVRQEQGMSNIWTLSLDGSAAKRLTNFNSKTILDFRWSRDGKQLGVLRHDFALAQLPRRDGSHHLIGCVLRIRNSLPRTPAPGP